MDRALSGGQVQRVGVGRIGAEAVALLQVRVPGETIHVVVTGTHGVGVIGAEARNGLRDAMRGTVSPDQARWRSHAEDARIVCAGDRWLDLVHGGLSFRVSAGTDGTLRLSEQSPTEAPPLDASWVTAAVARGEKIVEALLTHHGACQHKDLKSALKKGIGRLDRRVAAIQGDLGKMTAAGAAAERAQLFVAEAARTPRGATRLCATDWSTGEARPVEMELTPSKSAQEQLADVFRRARRMKGGMRIAQTRLHEAQTARMRLYDLVRALDEPEADLQVLEDQARAIAPHDFAGPSQRTGPTAGDRAKPPFRRFLGALGLSILVGRSATHNDRLTLHVARPHDLWLHAKGVPGAHVVVPLARGASCPSEALVEAAHLAMHFSDARGERLGEVQYTPRRYVRKPRGSAPGAVVVDREKVIVIRLEDATLRRLLASESDVLA